MIFNENMNTYPYIIYLDTKILGAAKQTVTYFKNNIFSPENTIVLMKYYKKTSYKIEKIFTQNKIPYRIISPSHLDKLSNGIVFYPFNAQSNCRFTANRNLTHVFVTHGESHKISSVKPIVRIYDYVITAGQGGIDRYLEHKIFFDHDIKQGRLMVMGDTFTGKTGLSENNPDNNAIPTILYAPTWEGGLPAENYSSLENIDLVFNCLVQLCKIQKINHIVIKPHPNTGHRIGEYKNKLLKLVNMLRRKNLKISLYRDNLELTWTDLLKLSFFDIELTSTLSSYYAKVAFCDISAIETQLLNERIPYYTFCLKTHFKQLLHKKNTEIYHKSTIILDDPMQQADLPLLSVNDFQKLREYMITPIIEHTEAGERITILAKRIRDNQRLNNLNITNTSLT